MVVMPSILISMFIIPLMVVSIIFWLRKRNISARKKRRRQWEMEAQMPRGKGGNSLDDNEWSAFIRITE